MTWNGICFHLFSCHFYNTSCSQHALAPISMQSHHNTQCTIVPLPTCYFIQSDKRVLCGKSSCKVIIIILLWVEVCCINNRLQHQAICSTTQWTVEKARQRDLESSQTADCCWKLTHKSGVILVFIINIIFISLSIFVGFFLFNANFSPFCKNI